MEATACAACAAGLILLGWPAATLIDAVFLFVSATAIAFSSTSLRRLREAAFDDGMPLAAAEAKALVTKRAQEQEDEDYGGVVDGRSFLVLAIVAAGLFYGGLVHASAVVCLAGLMAVLASASQYEGAADAELLGHLFLPIVRFLSR